MVDCMVGKNVLVTLARLAIPTFLVNETNSGQRIHDAVFAGLNPKNSAVRGRELDLQIREGLRALNSKRTLSVAHLR